MSDYRLPDDCSQRQIDEAGEPQVWDVCGGCSAEIYYGDEYWEIDGDILCEDCVNAKYRHTAED